MSSSSKQPGEPPDDPSECETESIGSIRESVPDPEADAVLRAIAYSPPRRPRSAVAPETPWGPSGRYLIQRRIGRGGMGTVYAATDTVLNRVIALKILDTTDADAADRARLLREAQIAAQVEHERIARVYDVGTHEGSAFVAMEYVSAGTLRQRMSRRDLPVPQIVDIATQIAEGLAELHSKGVIHRDLKPENVMLTPQGGVKLVDFGLARNTVLPDELGGPTRPTAEGACTATACGTPGYMAPEQCSGQPLDARVDIFALGVILYELITGERLFRGTTAGAIMTATLEGAPALSDGAWARVPDRLRLHTTRMLAHEPRARFVDGGDVLAALRELAFAMPGHRSLLPAATAQTISKETLREVPLQPAARARPRRWARHLVPASAVAVSAFAVYAWRAHSHAALPAPPPGMVRIDVGTIDVGRDIVEIERECLAIGAPCDRKQMYRELPRTSVAVPAFFLDRYEVTNEELAGMLHRFLGVLTVENDEDGHYPRYVRRNRGTGDPDVLVDLYEEFRGIEYLGLNDGFRARAGHERLPASLVSWYGARWYCEMRGKRLPTEDEWEAAARGREDRRFPWGDAMPRCGDVVIKNDGKLPMAPGCPAGSPAVRAVGASAQDVTPDGVHDLGGNVAEWTSSWFVESNRAAHPASASREAPRVIRGGSWAAAVAVRTSGRNQRPPGVMGHNLGFRCASDADDARP